MRIPEPDEITEYFARNHWGSLWEFSDRFFKLISWFLAVAALVAIAQKSESKLLGAIAATSFIFWLIIVFSSLIKASVTVQDWTTRKHEAKGSWKWLLIRFIATLIAVSSFAWALFIVANLFTALLSLGMPALPKN